jgi:hypothetical protein
MKLCPLFESIDYSPVPLGTSGIWFTAGVKAANAKLPREAIEAAIEEVEYSAEVTLSESRQKYLAKVVEQLRAMLPQDHADLTAHDSGLHGIRTGGGKDE